MLNQLVLDGFASRGDDPADRRNVFYALTDAGREVVEAALARRVDLLCERLSGLGETEKARLAAALATVTAGVEKLKKTWRD
jgi:DNA-binding MarR family transcriptional regulator